jgi:hypothetical protein
VLETAVVPPHARVLGCFVGSDFIVPGGLSSSQQLSVSNLHSVALEAEVQAALAELEKELWEETAETESKHSAVLRDLGLSSDEIQEEMRSIRARQSSESGVGMLYLLSPDFSTLARTRTQEQDPTFNSMKPAFLKSCI